MKEIELTQGKVSLVDDEDYEYLNQFKWYASKSKNTFYAHRKIGKHGRMIYMHRLIAGLDNIRPDLFPDHIDRNGLNNQKYNLRIATRSDNNSNRICIGASGYLGVFPTSAKSQTWFARIRKNGKINYLGTYKDKEEAALAYNKAALEIHGEFGNFNAVETIAHIHAPGD